MAKSGLIVRVTEDNANKKGGVMEATGAKVKQKMWWKSLAHYQEPVRWRGVWQAINSIGPYLATWFLMYLSLDISYWLTLALAIPAAGFLARSFIIQHDCGHGSFFKSQKVNDLLGSFIGLLTFIPYVYWRHDHAVHHATAGDLDRRTVGDIWTLTVKEYLELSFWKRVAYRLYRNPFIMFGIGSIYVFLIDYRLPRPGTAGRERKSVILTNLAIIGLIAILILTIGWKAYLMVQLPITMVASSTGVWLFYVQHQYEDVYWDRHESWDYEAVALQGSSFYKLPKVLQWFTGNIGFHHIHHLLPRVPNYNLERCHYENSVFREIKPITIASGMKSLRFRLWDEDQRIMVGYGPVREQIKKHRAKRKVVENETRPDGFTKEA